MKDWIWMPHAGHFICGRDCQYHLTTFVNGYIVSTVGELWFDRQLRIIHAQIHDPAWLAENRDLKGEFFDEEYKNKFGFEQVGADRLYETMVFHAKAYKSKCCPYVAANWTDLDFKGYNDADAATEGHYALCLKWSKAKAGMK